jgi:hypothetical protein
MMDEIWREAWKGIQTDYFDLPGIAEALLHHRKQRFCFRVAALLQHAVEQPVRSG